MHCHCYTYGRLFSLPVFLLELLQTPVSVLMIQSATSSSSWAGTQLLNWMPPFMTRYNLNQKWCIKQLLVTFKDYSLPLKCVRFKCSHHSCVLDAGFQMSPLRLCAQHARAEGVLCRGTPLRHRPRAGHRGAEGRPRSAGLLPPEVPVWGKPAASTGH